jgi:purine-nucleoside phosphorylase
MNREQFSQTLSFLKKKINGEIPLGLILGTGLGGLALRIKKAQSLAYDQIPYFPRSTVESHEGRLVWGSLAGRPVIALQGRFHLYEGYSPREIGLPVRILSGLGVKILIVSNAAGGLDPQYDPGDLMLITDHINFTGENPLVGPHEKGWGERFPDMSAVYDRKLAALAEAVALAKKIPLRRGVYLAVKGPSLETPAETRLLRQLGAQAVGMSTVMEVITAVQCRLRILGLSVISNVNRPDCQEPAALESIIATAQQAEPRLTALIEGVVAKLALEAQGKEQKEKGKRGKG